MRAIALALLLVATPAAAQKIQDRHPAMVTDTFQQRWDALPHQPLTFEERWEPVRRMLIEQSFRASATAAAPRVVAQAAPQAVPGSVEPVRETPVRVIKLVQIEGGPAQATCLRHRMRTVYRGSRWNCRR